MAYLHCHTKGCNWSQDDFYSWRYNPFTKILGDIKWLWFPRFVVMDRYYFEDISKFLGIKLNLKKKYSVPTIYISAKPKIQDLYWYSGAVENSIFSWVLLWVEILKDIKIATKMKWWTYKQFKKAKKAICPKCKMKNFDID